MDFSFRERRKYVGEATLFCGERRDARREETIHRVLLRRPCPVLSLLSLFLSSRRPPTDDDLSGGRSSVIGTFGAGQVGGSMLLSGSSRSLAKVKVSDAELAKSEARNRK